MSLREASAGYPILQEYRWDSALAKDSFVRTCGFGVSIVPARDKRWTKDGDGRIRGGGGYFRGQYGCLQWNQHYNCEQQVLIRIHHKWE